jgi:hypothetical protein
VHLGLLTWPHVFVLDKLLFSTASVKTAIAIGGVTIVCTTLAALALIVKPLLMSGLSVLNGFRVILQRT